MAYAMRRWLWADGELGGWDFFKDFVVDICWFFLGSPTIFFFDSGWGWKTTIQKKLLIFVWEWWLIFRVKLCLDKWVAIWSSCFCQLNGTNPTSWDGWCRFGYPGIPMFVYQWIEMVEWGSQIMWRHPRIRDDRWNHISLWLIAHNIALQQ